jgi:hypothetical protein
MAQVIFHSMTLEQAKTLAKWYEGQGEQDASVWFEIKGVEVPCVNTRNPKWFSVDEETQNVKVDCSPRR